MNDVAKIRQRPGMYAGDIRDGTALHNLVFGVATFAVARCRARPSSEINVILRSDSAVSVCLTGAEEWREDDLTTLAGARSKAATSIIECIRLEPDALDIAAGAYCDLCVVNALSDWMCDQLWCGDLIQVNMFRDGEFESSMSALKFSDLTTLGRQGLSTTFLPSDKIFPSIRFDVARLRNALDQLSEHSLGTRIALADNR